MQLGNIEVSLSLIRKCQGERNCYVILSNSTISRYIRLVICCVSLEIERPHRFPAKGGRCHDHNISNTS